MTPSGLDPDVTGLGETRRRRMLAAKIEDQVRELAALEAARREPGRMQRIKRGIRRLDRLWRRYQGER